jgi:hypothetical protein
MKKRRTPAERNELIAILGKAVRAQIEFWDLAQEIAEMVDVDLSSVIEFCQDAAIFADTGLELGETDLHDFLRSLGREDISIVRPAYPWVM